MNFRSKRQALARRVNGGIYRLLRFIRTFENECTNRKDTSFAAVRQLLRYVTPLLQERLIHRNLSNWSDRIYSSEYPSTARFGHSVYQRLVKLRVSCVAFPSQCKICRG